jgi:hypothetical protein
MQAPVATELEYPGIMSLSMVREQMIAELLPPVLALGQAAMPDG